MSVPSLANTWDCSNVTGSCMTLLMFWIKHGYGVALFLPAALRGHPNRWPSTSGAVLRTAGALSCRTQIIIANNRLMENPRSGGPRHIKSPVRQDGAGHEQPARMARRVRRAVLCQRDNNCRLSFVIRRRREPSSTRSPTRTIVPPMISGSTLNAGITCLPIWRLRAS